MKALFTRNSLRIALLAAVSVPLVAQPQPAAPGIDGVVKMIQAGLSDDLIIARLKKNGKSYDLSTEDMVKLKQAHVSDNVLKAMLDPNAVIPTALPTPFSEKPSGATPAVGTALPGNPNDPLTPHDSGIYVYTVDAEGKPFMTLLERADYEGSKTGGFLSSAMTYGIAKVKTKAVIPGQHASLRTVATPTFYFYFDDKAAGLGKGFGPGRLSSPKQFVLLKLEVTGKSRETAIMAANVFGASSGTDSKKAVPFRSEQIRPGLYRVTLDKPLEQGEYCFMASVFNAGAFGAGAAGAVDIFDFGYSPAEKNRKNNISTSYTQK